MISEGSCASEDWSNDAENLVFSYAGHKRRYFDEFRRTEVGFLLISKGKKILWTSMWTINCVITSILQNIFYIQHKEET